jgi:hypothetical protein
MITSDIRIVDVCWDDTRIWIRIVVDRESPEDDEIANEVEADVEGDFLPSASAKVTVEKIRAPSATGEYAPFDGHCARAYSRREP